MELIKSAPTFSIPKDASKEQSVLKDKDTLKDKK